MIHIDINLAVSNEILPICEMKSFHIYNKFSTHELLKFFSFKDDP